MDLASKLPSYLYKTLRKEVVTNTLTPTFWFGKGPYRLGPMWRTTAMIYPQILESFFDTLPKENHNLEIAIPDNR